MSSFVQTGAAFAGGFAVAALLFTYLKKEKKQNSSQSSSHLNAPSERKLKPIEEKLKENVYESVQSRDEYLLMHFGKKDELINPNFHHFAPLSALEFPERCAAQCINFAASINGPEARVLDLGCAVGAATFHLAKYFKEVVGIDFSKAFIETANVLKQEGKVSYRIRTEGLLNKPAVAEIPEDIDRKRVTFLVGDACHLNLDVLGQFDIVLGANLVCRLPQPRLFLETCPKLIKPGGYLVLPSPYTWLKEFTPVEEWIGGYTDESKGQPVSTVDGLHKHLDADFDLVYEEDMPFFIHETNRKNQWTVSHLTVWKRKSVSA